MSRTDIFRSRINPRTKLPSPNLAVLDHVAVLFYLPTSLGFEKTILLLS